MTKHEMLTGLAVPLVSVHCELMTDVELATQPRHYEFCHHVSPKHFGVMSCGGPCQKLLIILAKSVILCGHVFRCLKFPSHQSRVCWGVIRIDRLHFLAGCR